MKITKKLDRETAPLCPFCKERLGGWTNVLNNNKPKPDDVSICQYCETVLEFNDDMSLRIASQEVIESVMAKLKVTYEAMLELQKNEANS